MLNKALKQIRIFHGLSQGELAQRLDISAAFLSQVESGAKNVTMTLLEKYGKVFSMPPSSLLLFSEKIQSKNHSEKIRINVADKLLKMLEWISQKENFSRAQKNAAPK